MDLWILGCMVLLGVIQPAVQDASVRPEVAKYEEAIMKEMETLKTSGDMKKDGAMGEAMDRVKHLKPPDMEPTELIGMMGRVMQATMGLNIQVQDPSKMAAQDPKNTEDDKPKKKKKKDKKKKRKGPSLSNAGEL